MISPYTPLFLPGKLPALTEKPGRPQSTGLQRVRHCQSDPVCIATRLFCLWQFFFFFFLPQCVKSEGGTAAWLAGTLLALSVSLRHRTYGPIRVFSRAFCSWGSEGLFGLSFSIALPIQALKGPPCLGSFSVVPHIRHIEGLPGWGLIV